jgi:ribonuclease-3
MSDALRGLSKKIGYQFKDDALLERALTHRSVAGVPNNETIEFLGDAVLSVIAAHEAFMRWPNGKEGMLSKARAAYVCTDNLGAGAKRLKLGDYMKAAKDMRSSGTMEVTSVLADVVEALIGAAFIDGGLEAAKKVAYAILGPLPLEIPEQVKDAKTELQERIQGICKVAPTYRVTLIESYGLPLHFTAELLITEKVICHGDGANKKSATQDAARKALKLFAGLSDDEIREKCMP